MNNIKIKHLLKLTNYNNVCDSTNSRRSMKYILKKYNYLQDEYGNTFLHIAVLHNNIKYIKYLLKNNAKTNIKNNYGLIPKDLTTNPVIISMLENINI